MSIATLVLSPLEAQWVALARDHGVPAILGMARIGACFAWIPYLSPGVMPARMARSLVALMVVIGLWPSLQPDTLAHDLPQDLLSLGAAALGEALVGTAIGLVVALPFHIFHGLGAIVDTQRGAGVGALLDPVSGVEATEMANLIQLMSVMVFLASGGLVHLLEVLQASYALVPLGSAPSLQLEPLQAHAGRILAGAVRMALPVLLLLFLTEILLGLLSRFAQQMNAFSISLAVKSLLAFLALLIYLLPTVTGEVPTLRDSLDPLQLLAGAHA
ncbi:type III secretion system export apparatus subunit SctT [uncultured Stenotrophomonas sp.]|uniref:type III secretion system export apparatus subunit SctT n=1 Tax=uncultured Stenotrophomonas sp. TaxID=165438 RepID=UPI0025FDF8DD|nr:type III secretion system export apparatus subunit SctT [uncultured Stenotrophomonas sp.]